MKLCPKCNKENNLDDFYKKDGGRKQGWCKSCVLSLQKERWKQRKIKSVELLGGKCCKCGYDRNLAALDFHHVNPEEKEYNFNELVKRNWNEVVSELKKCVLLCKNCHAEEHNPALSSDNISKTYFELIEREKTLFERVKMSTGVCPVCSEEVYGTKYCSNKCRGIDTRKVKRPTKEVLQEQISSKPIIQVAKIYGVSDNTIRKWAKSYGIL